LFEYSFTLPIKNGDVDNSDDFLTSIKQLNVPFYPTSICIKYN